MGILVLDDMLAPLSFFWGSISGLSIICHLHIAHNITLFALHEHCLYFFWDHFNCQEKKKKGYAKRGVGRGEQTWCVMGDVQMVNALFRKKRFLVLKVIFYKIKISALQKKKKKKSIEMSISQPVTFTLQSKIIFKHGWLL